MVGRTARHVAATADKDRKAIAPVFTLASVARFMASRVFLRYLLTRGPSFVKHYGPGTALHPMKTVELAWARLQEQSYDLFNNNCEHLAYWCKTGHHWSPQANMLKEAVKVGAVVGLIALVASAAG